MTDIFRCPWVGTSELMIKYHDEEWGGIRLQHNNIYSPEILHELMDLTPDYVGYEIRLIFILEDGSTFAESIFGQNGNLNPTICP